MQHDRSSPETWLERYGDRLYRYALARVGNSAMAEDLVQETLLAALEARQRYAGSARESTWLTGILKHKIIDALRAGSRQISTDLSMDTAPDADSLFDQRGQWLVPVQRWADPDSAFDDSRFLETLNQCIDGLPARSAEAFRLREIYDLDTETICEHLEISSANNLWVVLSRARMKLRQCLTRRWFAVSAKEVEPC